MTMSRWILGLLLAAPLASPALALDDEVAEASVEVTDARIRWLPGESPLAGYMTLRNTGSEALRFVGASSDAFGQVGLHRSSGTDAGMQMEAVQAVDLPPGETVAFEPGGYHLMLEQRREPVEVGKQLPITLKFSDGSILQQDFEVHSPTLQ